MSQGNVAEPAKAVVLCILAYAFFALQDAAVKWLVADHSVFEILFWRSLTVTVACLLIGRKALWHQAWQSSSKGLLLKRGVLSILAWILYYSAARELSLAEMTTLYFSAPVIVTVLARLILKERATGWQWFAVVLGFVGVVIACQPGRMISPWPVAMTLLAALFWAFTYIQLRQVDGSTSVMVQMLITNAVFVVCTGVPLPWTYSATLTLASAPVLLGMVAAGLVGGVGQYLLFLSFTRGTATLLAPFEYTGLIWAFMLSSLIWGTVLDMPLIIGAGLIAISGTLAMLAAQRRSRVVVGAESSTP